MNDFYVWYDKDETIIQNDIEVYDLETAWKAAREQALREAIDIITGISDSHKVATNECGSECDYIIAWDTAIKMIRSLQGEPE